MASPNQETDQILRVAERLTPDDIIITVSPGQTPPCVVYVSEPSRERTCDRI